MPTNDATAVPVNVLAVLETTDACLHNMQADADAKALHIARLSEARAAVAELIEAAVYIEFAMRDGAVFSRDYAAERMRKARIRAQGAAA